jgi:hypothetical protein
MQRLSFGLSHQLNFSPPIDQDFRIALLPHKGCETGGLGGTGLCGCYFAHHITLPSSVTVSLTWPAISLSTAHAMERCTKKNKKIKK